MKKVFLLGAAVVLIMLVYSCNNGMSVEVSGRENAKTKRDRSQRTVIDSSKYIDFTVRENNAQTVSREDLLNTLNNGVFKNGNSVIRIRSQEGTIEITSDDGFFSGKTGCQVYGVYALDVKAASTDCLYLRRDMKKDGFVMIDNVMYRNEAMPDLAVCLPLYGYSKNRIEVSPIMDGYAVMPSGTYWKN